ncbi:MAG: NAD-dependent epimerase/dehydratase family protein [Arachidicoccus sp.]|nr:NAD-dependent epimerase/dehydratase family protein [Arachidicoccus sp.]
MVTGNGMIANKFASYNNDDRFLVFASGVSNSKNKLQNEYEREINLLKKCIVNNKEKRLIYFSTCSIYDISEQNSPYVIHKLNVEKIIQEQAAHYLIVRASNVVGKSQNQNTVLNFFYHHIKEKRNFDVWKNASRNVIDIDDLFLITDYILRHDLYQNETVNVASKKAWNVLEIINEIENSIHIQATYSIVEKGNHIEIDTTKIDKIVEKLNINFGSNYLKKIIQKYYSDCELS